MPGAQRVEVTRGSLVAPEWGEMTIREEPLCSATALPLLARLTAELAERYPGETHVSRLSPADFAAPRGTFLVVRLGEAAVGCGALQPSGGETAEIKRMYVEPRARRRGLARRLLHALEAAARQLGYEYVRLEAGHRQPEALRLYESAGYLRVGAAGDLFSASRSSWFEKALYAEADRRAGEGRAG
jgi:GNAT superfamily N-acetyltransferase